MLSADFSPHLPDGVRVGHAEVAHSSPAPGTSGAPAPGLSGTTAILLPPGTTTGVDCRGGGPATHETNILAPGTLGYGADAVVLTGGSALGLAAARGVQDFLVTHGVGCEPVPGVRVPVVPAAAIYDLGRTPAHIPDASTGMAAAGAASPEPARGSVGAGAGAWMGRGLARGGLGFASVVTDSGWRVTALAVANPMGSIFDARGHLFASGVLSGYGYEVPPVDPAALATQSVRAHTPATGNTTIACLITDAPLTDAAITRLAATAHAGLARAIHPSHTLFDGDTVFAASVPHVTSREESTSAEVVAPDRVSALTDYRLPDLTWLGVAAADALTLAIVDAVLSAESNDSSPVPAVRDFAPETVSAWEEVHAA